MTCPIHPCPEPTNHEGLCRTHAEVRKPVWHVATEANAGSGIKLPFAPPKGRRPGDKEKKARELESHRTNDGEWSEITPDPPKRKPKKK